MMTLIMFLLITLLPLTTSKENAVSAESDKYYLYVGAYTETEEEGIAIFLFDVLSGDLEYISTVKGIKNPSYLAIHPKRKLLLAVNEVSDGENKSGVVSSFSINPLDGSLRLINFESSLGAGPCYVSIDHGGDFAVVANYGGGTVALLPIESTGKLLPGSMVQHSGSGPNTARQGAPHAHTIMFDKKYGYALSADLGIDKVITYSLGSNPSKLVKQSEFSLAPGAGPRHLDFHPNQKFAYIINELNSTVTACSYDAKSGKLTEIESVSTLPADFTGQNSCADIHISRDGRYVYGSNRGHDSIVVFKADPTSGKLTYVSHHSVKGKTPRNFMIDPTGKFLLVANQGSNNIVVFKIDAETGKLISNGVEVQSPKPVCLKMYPKK
ncbi:MAG: lactonase family protein [Cyclobacteriaceae bacterium]|nr:lactonase family protein [Cyclobacteriaceae bacterium]